MTDRAGERAGATGAAIKRRGILAAAGAVVAGIAMKQAAQPVAAAAVTADNFIANGTASIGLNTSTGTFAYGVFAKGSGSGVFGTSGSGEGVHGNTDAPAGSGKAGVYGLGNGSG